MRVLVTGAGGQLGRELAPALARHDGILFGREQLDVTDHDAVRAAVASHTPDAIIHAAAWTDVDGCERDPDRAREVHVDATRALVEAARDAFVVVVSTDYVFDGTLGRPYVETDETNPLQVYGRTKLEGEVAATSASGRVAIARTAWLYGQGRNFVSSIVAAARRGPVSVVDDQVGSPTSCADLARALVRLVEARATGVFHTVNTGEVSRYGFARVIVAAAGLDPGLVTPIATADAPPRAAARPAYAPLEPDAWRAHGFEPLPPWQEASERVLPDIVAGL